MILPTSAFNCGFGGIIAAAIAHGSTGLKNFAQTEQLTIANYLDDQTQKIDRLIANKKAQAEKYFIVNDKWNYNYPRPF